MGCRGNIQIQFSNKRSIYFYTHWRGDSIKEVVQSALGRRQRWNDEAYLARIIFSELIKEHESEETGYGIAPYQIEEGSPLIKVNPSKQTVTFDEQTCSFSDYVGNTLRVNLTKEQTT